MRTFVKASVPPSARTLAARWYREPEVFEQERRRIFARRWICVARASALREGGDFVTVDVAGESLIVTRDQSARVHAFYNVCRHRGTRMCLEPAGRFRGAIQCPYHAWTYALDGSLSVARNMEGIEGFERRAYPLHEAHVAEFEGFVFVAIDPEDSFEVAFEPLRNRFAAWRLYDLRVARRIVYDVACNWKLVFLNYSECYHCPVLHPQLERLSASDSGMNDLHEGPFLGGYSTLRHADASLTMSGTTSRRPLPGISGENLGRVYYYTIFPSLLLSLHPDYVMTHRVEPVEAARTRIVCEWLFERHAMEQDAFDPSDAVEFWDLTNRQDWHANELTQLGVGSRAYQPGPYSAQEGLLHEFDRYYLSVMA